mmetsp:Transcript_77574/g.95065  ORF Transcript_77574/g.95065 Transcript_77574/m.95065 type:complete len:260 (+) Transcript_77574:32-811(+)
MAKIPETTTINDNNTTNNDSNVINNSDETKESKSNDDVKPGKKKIDNINKKPFRGPTMDAMNPDPDEEPQEPTDPKVAAEVEREFGKDTRNKNLLHLRREKFLYCGRKVFEWEQTLQEITIWIMVPQHIKAKDINCIFDKKHLYICQKGKFKPFCDAELAYQVSVSDCTWYFDNEDGKNTMVISMTKLNMSQNWLRIFQRQKPINPLQAEKTKKSMMLERFARENPNFDFSSATFDGHCPEPGNFLDGINTDNFKKDFN